MMTQITVPSWTALSVQSKVFGGESGVRRHNGIAVVLSVFRALFKTRRKDTMIDTSDEDTRAETETWHSNNPYHPPNVAP